MEYYFAPMEGLTDSVYRRLHHKFFSGVDKYYMPFFSPTVHRSLTEREARELPLADSESFTAVPQLLTKSAEDFLWAARQCADRGYGEVNLNLGCPSGTVFSKGKGSGMLRDPDGLERFLDTIFASSPLPISLKTRLGVEDSEEFERLLEIYNRYPVSLLIVHPGCEGHSIRETWIWPLLKRLWSKAKTRFATMVICARGRISVPFPIAIRQSGRSCWAVG